MPETGAVTNVVIPLTRVERRYLFDQLRIQEVLVGALDMGVWQEQMNRLAELEATGANYPVQEGSLSLGASPEFRYPDGQRGAVEWLKWDSAREVVRLATAGRAEIKLVPPGHPSYSTSRRHVMISPTMGLEEAGLQVSGYQTPIGIDRGVYEGEDTLVSIYELRDGMGNYRKFRQHGRYIQFLKEGAALRRQGGIASEVKVPAVWDSKRVSSFEKFFSGIKSGMTPTENPFLDLPMLPTGTLSSLRWGIEIEAVDIEGVATPEYWSLKSDGSLRRLDVSSMPPVGMQTHTEGCASETPEEDCTCEQCFLACDCGYEDEQRAHSSNPRSSQTGEWVSPILRSYHSRGLKHLCDGIETRRTNTSPGIHVHVEASHLTPEQATNVSILYSALEPLFESEYKREVRNYCRSMQTEELITRLKTSSGMKLAKTPVTQYRSQDRYWTVNLQSLSAHGTIEFRAMGPRYNYEFLVRWAHFLREIVNIASANVPQKEWASVKTFRDLVVLFSKYGKETPTPEWAGDTVAVDAITASLGTESRNLPNIAEVRGRAADVFDDYNATTARISGDARTR